MSAKYQNIVNPNRTRLEEVIPLRTPYSLIIDPSSICNFKCNFCAIHGGGVDKKPNFQKQLMDFSLYKKAIDSAGEFPDRVKKLTLSLYGEPLMNPKFPEMVRYAKDAKVAEFIEAVTNASLLNSDLNQRIVDAGIDRIRISIEGVDHAGYLRVSGVNLDMERFVQNIRDLHERSGKCEVYCKIVDIAVPTEEEKQRFFDMFSDVCDKFFIDSVIPLWPDFDQIYDVKDFNAAEANRGAHGQALREVHICPIPFYTMAIHTDGEVGVCCADWKRELIFGNVQHDSLINVWGSPKMRRFWVEQARGNRDTFGVCRSCMNPVYDCTDYIDPYGEMICKKLAD